MFIVLADEDNSIWLTDLFNQINSEETISKFWNTSLIKFFKNKDDAIERGSSRGFKLFEYSMKIVESKELEIRKSVNSDQSDMHFIYETPFMQLLSLDKKRKGWSLRKRKRLQEKVLILWHRCYF